jgi:glycerol-3-phosphate O-acyltransferase
VLARLYDWLEVFHGEFFSARGPALSAHVAAFLSHFEALGWTERGTGALRATELGAPHLAFLAEQMRAVLESYYAAVSALVVQQGEPIARRALEKRIRDQFDRAALLGEIELPESNNPVTFGNAIDLLLRRGVLASAARSDSAASFAQRAGGERRPAAGRGEPLLVRGPAWSELEPLRERLATALRAR